MNVTTIYIHAGSPKSASSALQNIFYQNRDELENHGYLYPSAGIAWGHSAHHALAGSIGPGCFDKTVEEIDRCSVKNVIISSEGFYTALTHNPSRLMDAIREKINPSNVKLVMAVRRADSFIESMFFQEINAWYFGQTSKRRVKIQDHVRARIGNPLSTLTAIKNAKELGLDIHLQPYSINIIDDMLGYFGLPKLTVDKLVKNDRLPFKKIALLYVLSSAEQSSHYQKVILNNRNKFDNLIDYGNDKNYGLFTDEEKIKIIDKMQESYNELGLVFEEDSKHKPTTIRKENLLNTFFSDDERKEISMMFEVIF